MNGIIKAMFIDSEGTLRDEKRTIKKDVISMFDTLKENGIYVVVTSGLPRFMVRNIKNQSHASHFIISSNGADIYNLDNKKSIKSYYLDRYLVYSLWKEYKEKFNIILGVGDYEYSSSPCDYSKNSIILDENNIQNDFYQCHISQKQVNQNESAINELNSIKKNFSDKIEVLIGEDLFHKLCYHISELTDNEIARILRAGRFLELVTIKETIMDEYNNLISIGNQCADFTEYNPNGEIPWFSINNIEATKGNGVKRLCEYLDVPKNQRMAIGNDYNDRTMIDAVGIFACPSNSNSHLLSESNYVYDERDGISKVLRKVMINNESFNRQNNR